MHALERTVRFELRRLYEQFFHSNGVNLMQSQTPQETRTPKIGHTVHVPEGHTGDARITGGLAQVRYVVCHWCQGIQHRMLSLQDQEGEYLGRFPWEGMLRERQHLLRKKFGNTYARRIPEELCA